MESNWVELQSKRRTRGSTEVIQNTRNWKDRLLRLSYKDQTELNRTKQKKQRKKYQQLAAKI